MNEKPIEVGDLVMVVHGCCEGPEPREEHMSHVGGVYTVAKIYGPIRCVCHICGTEGATKMANFGDRRRAPLPWLKRLDPDALHDDIPTAKVLTA